MLDMNWPWDALAAFGAFVTAGVAWWQIGSLKSQQRGWKTLEACERYDIDPVLHDVLCTIREARDSGKFIANPRPYRLEIAAILNYLEGIIVGVDQNFYDERIVRDHLEDIIRYYVSEFLSPDMTTRMEMGPGYQRLKDRISEWDRMKPRFKF